MLRVSEGGNNMRKTISILVSMVLGMTLLAGCASPKENKKEEIKEAVKKVNIVAPDGLPSIAIAQLAKENPEIKNGYDLIYTVEKSPESLSTTVMKQEADIAIVPSNMAAIAYNKTSNYKIAGTVGMGSFYLVSTDNISEIKDLEGKEVGNTGKGLTPDITVQSVLKANEVDLSSLKFNYVNSASELVPLLATEKISTGFVPEPALTALMIKNPNMKIVKSLNDAWKEANKTENGYPQSTVIVKADFADENKEFVDSFLGQLSNSIEWANKNSKEAGEYAKEIGVSTEPKIIEKSMERSNLKFILAKDMIEDYNNYFKKLFDYDIKTVGGKLPDEKIYLSE